MHRFTALLTLTLLLTTGCAALDTGPSSEEVRQMVREELHTVIQDAREDQPPRGMSIPGPGFSEPVLAIEPQDCAIKTAKGWPLPVAAAYARGYLHTARGECPGKDERCDPAEHVEIRCGGETHTLASLLELDVQASPGEAPDEESQDG